MQTTTKTFRFDPTAHADGWAFKYWVEGSSPLIVIEGVGGLLSQYRDLFIDNDVLRKDVLLEVTADIQKTMKDFRPSIRLREGDAPDKYVKRYETWIVSGVHGVKAVLKPPKPIPTGKGIIYVNPDSTHLHDN